MVRGPGFEIRQQPRRLGLGPELVQGQQGLDLRCESQAVSQSGVVERLDSEAVADEPQSLLQTVQDGEGEHAHESAQARDPPAGEGPENDLGG